MVATMVQMTVSRKLLRRWNATVKSSPPGDKGRGKLYCGPNPAERESLAATQQEHQSRAPQSCGKRSCGAVMQSIIAEQVKYIKSLPLEAADRVYDIQNRAIEAVVTGGRAEHFAKEIAASGDIAKSRADLIARTELGRATGALDQARALSIGSNGYIWRTAEDGDVRHSHREMEGKFVEWGKPPTLDGMTGHAGELPNCRCYKEIVFPTSQSYPA